MGSYPPSTFSVKRVAIIGAGPAGLSAAKYLVAQNSFDEVVIFEQQDEVGGIWNYTDLAPGSCPVPQQDPFCPPDKPIRLSATAPHIFTSPMYETLHANISKSVMQFSCQDFP